jgi:hypothetical protein
MLLFNELLQTQEYNITGDGGVVVGGEVIIKLSYVGSGGVVLGGGTATVNYSQYFDQQIVWQTRSTIDLTQELFWNSGRVPLRWYRVTGCCQFPTAAGDGIGEGMPGGCEVLPFQSNDDKCVGALGKNQFIQNIIASSTSDVCKILKELRWKWPICDMQRFSRPAESQFVDPDDECNILEPVEFCNKPECQEFCLASDTNTKIGVTVEIIDAIFNVVGGSGGIVLGGTASARVIPPSATGTGGIVLSGEAAYAGSYWSYEPELGNTDIILSGEANIVSSYWAYTGSGDISLAGESSVTSPVWGWIPDGGGIMLDGEAEAYPDLPYTGSGTILLSGLALWGNYYVTGSGGITIDGTAPVTTPEVHYIGEGTITLAGEAPVVSPDWHFTGSGSVSTGGTAPASITSSSWEYTGSGTIVLSGDAEERSSEDGNWWYTGSGSIILDGTASKWRYIGTGSILLGGESTIGGTWQGELESSVGAKAFIESFEVNYLESDIDVETLASLSSTISTRCSTCGAIPVVLDMTHNLNNAAVLKEFLNRNGYVLSDSMKLRYNRKSDSWQGNVHFRGTSSTGSDLERWTILAEWACTDELAAEELGNYIWKYSLYIKKKNLVTGMDFDSRVLLAFPAVEICKAAERVGLDFSFAFDTSTRFVNAEFDIVVDVRLLYDNIGLFKSDAWLADPDLLINISQDGLSEEILRQDIKPIFPKDEELVILGEGPTTPTIVVPTIIFQ